MQKRDFKAICLFHFRLGVTAAESALQIQDAFGEGSINVRTSQRWFAKFRSGDEMSMPEGTHLKSTTIA